MTLLEIDGFRDSEKEFQRVIWEFNGVSTLVDLVPYGGLESPKGTVRFSDGDFEMSTIGFETAAEEHMAASIGTRVKCPDCLIEGVSSA